MPSAVQPGLWHQVRLTLDMIKIEHSVFALPFALIGALLAWRDAGAPSGELAARLPWIVLAMVGARSAAMAFNRVVDAAIDAQNPRTAGRHLPAGLLSRSFAVAFTAASAAVFVAAAAMLNPLCLALSPLALAVVLGYSYTKRFTSLSHVVLGFALGIAPAAAWIAMRGSLDARVLLLTAAVLSWTAGFDILYACQDIAFDRRHGLHSLPARLGVARALGVARLLHGGMVVCLVLLWRAFGLTWVSGAGVALVAALLVAEHRLVRPHDLSRVNAAFFTVNGWVSVALGACWAADILRRVG